MANAPFEDRLYLNKYFLSLFNASSISDNMFRNLNSIEYEGIDEDINQTKFYSYLKQSISEQFKSKFKDYDDNIISYIEHINKNRKNKISLKYFQYIAILFTEIFLYEYFNNKYDFIENLNKFSSAYVSDYNQNHKEQIEKNDKTFIGDDLNKLAYMCATGSGKTIIMHINLLQMKHYNKQYKKYSNIILITPNERLTNQHISEFSLSNIKATHFSNISFDTDIKVLEISKLKDVTGPETYDYRNFGNDNLVFVDEGHRGSSGEEWKKYRDSLVSVGGFSFEYSATFKEAISERNADLNYEYERAIVFDYQYLYFRNDGYGKDYHIMNLKEAIKESDNDLYLTGCLLTYYEQLKYYLDNKDKISDYLIEKPLMVFVGTTVVKTENPDVVKIILFLENFISDKEKSKRNINKILKGNTGIKEKITGKDLFYNKFTYIKAFYDYNDDNNANFKIFDDILKIIFSYNKNTYKLHLSLYAIKSNNDEEIGIKIGDSEKAFAVVTVGDTSGLINSIKNITKKINVSQTIKVDKSLFSDISKQDSSINVLIGSKKFKELSSSL